MAWQYPISETSSDFTITLGTTDSIYVGIGVFISESQPGGSAIEGEGSNQNVFIDGSVAGGTDVDLRGGYNSAVDDFVRIGAGAKIFADSFGVDIRGNGNTIENNGTIESRGQIIDMTGTSATMSSEIDNNGTMIGEFGIDTSAGTQAITLRNTGSITGTEFAYEGGDAVDSIYNSGIINGYITLGGGSDLYDGRKGTITGDDFHDAVLGNDGNDTIYGGVNAEALNGGSGFDLISGGKGADTLTGGADGDTFLYTSATDSTVKAGGRDLITDFEHEVDRIDLSKLHPATKDDAFKFVGSAPLKHAGDLNFIQHDAAGTDHDYTMIEGSIGTAGKPDFEIELSGLITLTRDDFIL